MPTCGPLGSPGPEICATSNILIKYGQEVSEDMWKMLKVNDERRTDDENDGRSRIGKDQLSL